MDSLEGSMLEALDFICWKDIN